MGIADVKLDEKIKQKIQEPVRWKVLFLNDDHTPMEFVVELMTLIFKHTQDTARDLTLKIHK